MPKQFYTEHDIEDLFHSGVKSLQVTDDVVLTELAYEKANRLGLQLITDRAHNPTGVPATPTVTPVAHAVSQPQPASSNSSDIEKRIRSAVIAKLGNQVDAKLLDNIIHRVVKGIGLK